MAQNVETTNVVITEPSDQNEELQSERPCFTKKHLYIAIGVVFVVAISLIGSLLDFSPASDQITEESIREGTLETFPEFDTNNDGYIDRAEFTQWSAERIAGRKRFTSAEEPEPVQTVTPSSENCGNSTCVEPSSTEIDNQLNPIDLNRDGRISRDEAIAFALRILEAIRRLLGLRGVDPALQVAPPAESRTAVSPQCETPFPPGFPGRRKKGWVGACKAGYQLWCYSSPFCTKKKKCHRSVINVAWQQTDTCCGSEIAANCTSCECGGTYSFVPEGKQSRVRAFCHWLSTYHCGEVNTHVPSW
jgi:hypothetical protein